MAIVFMNYWPHYYIDDIALREQAFSGSLLVIAIDRQLGRRGPLDEYDLCVPSDCHSRYLVC